MFDVEAGRYVCKDKYFGRGLDKAGVMESLYTFLHNGRRLRLELISPILRRLRQLYHMISRQNTFRFYSSSLLIMYDGVDWDSEDSDSLCAHGSSDEDEEEMSDEEQEEASCSPAAEEEDDDFHAPPLWRATSKDSCLRCARVDVRMIDFAHVTHQGFRGDRTVHSGPDSGYLFGVKNLILFFEQLLSQYSNSMKGASSAWTNTSYAVGWF